MNHMTPKQIKAVNDFLILKGFLPEDYNTEDYSDTSYSALRVYLTTQIQNGASLPIPARWVEMPKEMRIAIRAIERAKHAPPAEVTEDSEVTEKPKKVTKKPNPLRFAPESGTVPTKAPRKG